MYCIVLYCAVSLRVERCCTARTVPVPPAVFTSMSVKAAGLQFQAKWDKKLKPT